MLAKLIALTQPINHSCSTPGQLIAYCARVSNPSNQDNHETSEKLLKYCFENRHWSVFEMVTAVFEINTTRDIGRQILRHRSFSFQEFSQRYAKVLNFSTRECRLQDIVDRQNSIDTEDEELKEWWETAQLVAKDFSSKLYDSALHKGVAKELARAILPEGLTETKMYMSGTLRSWIHYCQIRCGSHTQKEHREIAGLIRKILIEEIPEIKEVM